MPLRSPVPRVLSCSLSFDPTVDNSTLIFLVGEVFEPGDDTSGVVGFLHETWPTSTSAG